MDDLARSGRLLVPEEVMFELKAQDDELLAWVKDRADLIVAPTSRAVMLEARAVLVDHEHLTKTGTGPRRPFCHRACGHSRVSSGDAGARWLSRQAL